MSRMGSCVRDRITWPIKPEISTFLPFTEKICQPTLINITAIPFFLFDVQNPSHLAFCYFQLIPSSPVYPPYEYIWVLPAISQLKGVIPVVETIGNF